MFKNLLSLTAIFEGATGLVLMVAPVPVVSLLLGATINEPVGIFMSRLTGAALATISIICWSNRNIQVQGIGIISALLFYNTAAVVLLVSAWMSGLTGLGVWPASALHVLMAIWCLKFIVK